MNKLENWTFKNGSILSSYSPYSECSDIFQAVCDELGEYYKQHGFKYARSGPHLTRKTGDIKLKLSFWSSSSNTPGQSVSLEIIPSFESVSLAKHLSKTKKDNGYLFGHMAVFEKSISCQPECDVVVRYPFKEELKRSDPNEKNLLIYSNNVNVYGITTPNFVKLVNYINYHVVSLIEVLQDEAPLGQFLNELPDLLKQAMFVRKSINSKLPEYLELKFPKLTLSI